MVDILRSSFFHRLFQRRHGSTEDSDSKQPISQCGHSHHAQHQRHHSHVQDIIREAAAQNTDRGHEDEEEGRGRGIDTWACHVTNGWGASINVTNFTSQLL